MTDPRPLLEETTDELERTLLREAREGTASPELRRRTLMALGLGAPAANPPRNPLLRGGALKLAGAVLIVGAGVLVYLASRREAPRLPARDAVAPTHVAEVPPPVPSASVAPVALAPAPTPSTVASVRPHASAAVPRPSAGSSLALETALIDRARQALYAGDKEAALRALDDYDSRFPAGVLAPEAKKLRVRAGAVP